MILETDQVTEAKLRKEKDMVNWLWYDNISLYIDYFDLYSILMSLVYNGHNRIVINSGVSFFLNLRKYILFSNDIKFDKQLLSKYFDKMLIRFMMLVHKTNQPIYLYKSSLEVLEFCEYYNFNYIIIKSYKELESLTKKIL